MTLQQLEYILAVNQFRHFAKAAEYCRVTQPTLSAMIQKLEEELDTRIFDRSQQPVCSLLYLFRFLRSIFSCRLLAFVGLTCLLFGVC